MPGVDALGEGGAEGIGERRRGGQIEFGGALCGNGGADEAAGVGGHEGDRLRRGVGGGDHQVAFIFPVFVVGDDHHFSLPDIGDQIFNRIECELTHIRNYPQLLES